MVCPNCGTQNPEGAAHCGNCGAALSAAPTQEQPGAQPPPPAQPPVTQPPGTPPPTSPTAYGAPPQYQQPGVFVPNYLVQAILVTIFCCLPAGIPAIVFAAQVNSKLAVGDVAGAMQSSKNAKIWCWVAVGAGVSIVVFYLLLAALIGFGTITSN